MRKRFSAGPRYIPRYEQVDAEGRYWEDPFKTRLARLGPQLRDVHRKPPDVDLAMIRAATNMTQREFARRFGFPVATLRHWEHGTRRPRGAALVLLRVIRYRPVAVDQALKNARLRELGKRR